MIAEQDRLVTLRNRLLNDIKKLEADLEIFHHKLSVVDEAYGLILEDSRVKRDDSKVKVVKDKYKKMGLQDAILDCINTGPALHKWTRPQSANALRP